MNSFQLNMLVQLRQPVMPDDHSKVVPLLPIPNRTVKRLSADDSADSRVKVGHRQASYLHQPPYQQVWGLLGCNYMVCRQIKFLICRKTML